MAKFGNDRPRRLGDENRKKERSNHLNVCGKTESPTGQHN